MDFLAVGNGFVKRVIVVVKGAKRLHHKQDALLGGERRSHAQEGCRTVFETHRACQSVKGFILEYYS